MKSIHQFVAGFAHSDAISNEALVLRGIFRSWGYGSDIFCEKKRILPELRPEAQDVAHAAEAVKRDDVVLLHLSSGCLANDVFADLNCRKALLYHNITPPEYFRGLQEQIASGLAKGREQAKRLATRAEVNLADSRFNADELAQWGYRDPKVLPLVLDFARLRSGANRATLKKYGDGQVNVIFVGRCVPNKRIEDCLAAFHYFNKYVEPASRFIHIGSFAGTEQYHALLLTLTRDLQLHAVEMVGAIRQDELNAYYQTASLFLSMSEHEGFCIPVIESMVHDVPVLAFAAGAVPDTLEGAGVLFREKRFDLVAEMMGRLVKDAGLRSAVIEGQRKRLARLEQRDLAAELRGHLQPLL